MKSSKSSRSSSPSVLAGLGWVTLAVIIASAFGGLGYCVLAIAVLLLFSGTKA